MFGEDCVDSNSYYQQCLGKAREKSPEDLKTEIIKLKKKIAEREAHADIDNSETGKMATNYYALLDALRG